MNMYDVDNYVWKVFRILLRDFPWNDAENLVSPVRWYIRTGRAPWEWCKLLTAAKPFMVARRLRDGGTYEEALTRVHQLIGWE